MNYIIISGNLVMNPELRYTPSGAAIVDIRLAHNDRRRGTDGKWIDESSFFDVTFWGDTAKSIHENTQKGSAILVTGKLRQERWEQDGQSRSKVRIIASEYKLLQYPKQTQQDVSGENTSPTRHNSRSFNQNQQLPISASQVNDDIPF